jgi:hypothetical protein
MYSFLDRGLMINPPLRVSYSVTSIMSQRSLFIQSLGNIFYEAIRTSLLRLTFPHYWIKCLKIIKHSKFEDCGLDTEGGIVITFFKIIFINLDGIKKVKWKLSSQ